MQLHMCRQRGYRTDQPQLVVRVGNNLTLVKSWQPPETLYCVCSALLSIPHALAMEEHQLLLQVQSRHLLNFGTLPPLSVVSRRNTLSRYQLIDTSVSQISSVVCRLLHQICALVMGLQRKLGWISRTWGHERYGFSHECLIPYA